MFRALLFPVGKIRRKPDCHAVIENYVAGNEDNFNYNEIMQTIEKSIEVNAPASTVYNQWTQFEEFPRFMEGVEEVQQLSDNRLHWKAKIAGKIKEWDAEIFEQKPDERIAWRSATGAKNSGMLNFFPIGANTTRITLTLSYEPEGAMEKMGDAIGLVSGRIEGDLKRFKEFIEARGSETGGWRGEIAGRGAETESARKRSEAMEAEPRSKRMHTNPEKI
jgi:uncharacterized membrane protein